ncbi:MAG: ferritin family protein [Desulfobacteraceae bacterium]|nr:ferritin family protein [Desulfobacteraceae bacterium]
MESLLKTAIIEAIMIENRSLKFYRAMSTKVDDIRCKDVLERLARKEEEHLESFCNLYPGNEDDLYHALVKNNIYDDPYYRSLLNSIHGNSTEIDILRIALKEETACIECYSAYVETIREPAIRDIFVQNLEETRNHAEMIEEECERLIKPEGTRRTGAVPDSRWDHDYCE